MYYLTEITTEKTGKDPYTNVDGEKKTLEAGQDMTIFNFISILGEKRRLAVVFPEDAKLSDAIDDINEVLSIYKKTK